MNRQDPGLEIDPDLEYLFRALGWLLVRGALVSALATGLSWAVVVFGAGA